MKERSVNQVMANQSNFRRSVAICGCLCAVFAHRAHSQSGGFGLYEVATPNAGEAYAGQSALANDASAAYYNAAGMTYLHGRQMVFGGQLLALSMKFQPDGGNSATEAGTTKLAPAAYMVASLTDRIRVGFSFNQPFGAALNYPNDWAGRYFIQDIQLIGMDFRPAVAFRVKRWLSVGGGPSIQRISLSKSMAVPNLLDPGRTGGGVLHATLHDWGTGIHAGLLLEVGPRTRLGVAYRSRTRFQLRGESTLSNVGPVTAGLLAQSLSGATPFEVPQGANVSLAHFLTPRVTLLTDAGWTNWRHFREQTTTLPDHSTVVTDAHWRDTWRAGAGLRYRASHKLTLQTGSSYDSSPVSDWNRTPDVPVGRQVRIALGAQYAIAPSATLGGSYTYIDLGRPGISHLQSPLAGTLDGRYSGARLPVLALTLTLHPAE